MRTTVRTTIVCVTALLLVSGGTIAQAAFIDAAVKISGNATAINLVMGGLVDGVGTYSDRTHQLVDIPEGLLGGDLVQVSNDDKGSDPYQVDVTIGTLSALYVGLDDREAQPKAWMSDPGQTGLPAVFFNTGAKIGNDEGGDGVADLTYSLWTTIAPPGTYSLGANGEATGSNYIIFASNKIVVPEPGSLVLIGMGLMGLVGLARRRN